MKTSLASAILAITLLGAVSAAQAQFSAEAAPDRAHSIHTLSATEFAVFANTYALGNGQVVTLSQRGNHYFVQLKSSLRAQQRDAANGLRPAVTRLRVTGPDTFVTDNGTQIKFRDDGDQITIDHFERLPEALVAANERNVRMIAGR